MLNVQLRVVARKAPIRTEPGQRDFIQISAAASYTPPLYIIPAHNVNFLLARLWPWKLFETNSYPQGKEGKKDLCCMQLNQRKIFAPSFIVSVKKHPRQLGE